MCSCIKLYILAIIELYNSKFKKSFMSKMNEKSLKQRMK